MDADVINGRETMAAEGGDGGGGRGKAVGAGGRKHLSSIANHVLHQCSLYVLAPPPPPRLSLVVN